MFNNDDEIFLPARQVDDSDTSLTEVLQRNETEEITNSNADIFVADMQECAEAAIEESASVDAGNIENDGTANVAKTSKKQRSATMLLIIYNTLLNTTLTKINMNSKTSTLQRTRISSLQNKQYQRLLRQLPYALL